MENIVKQIDQTLRLGRLWKVPVIGSWFRGALIERLIDLTIGDGAIRVLHHRMSPIAQAHSLYMGLQESLFIATAKTMMGLPQDLLLCPFCYSAYGKENPLKINIHENVVESVECDEHGVICYYKPHIEFIPLLRKVLTYMSGNIPLLERFFRFLDVDSVIPAQKALCVVESVGELSAGRRMAELTGKLMDFTEYKILEQYWSKQKLEFALSILREIRDLVDEYSELVERAGSPSRYEGRGVIY